MSHTRRNVLKTAAASMAALSFAKAVAGEAGGGLVVPATQPGGPDRWKGLKVGVASYSFRKLPLEQTIAGIKRVDLHYVSIKDMHLKLGSTPQERKDVARQFLDAGITPISCGVITIKDEPSARQAFEYARDLGVPTIVCNPDPTSLPLLDKLVKEFDLRIAIHNHGPEAPHFKSPYDVMNLVGNLDPRVGLCIDVGHTARAGVDPVEAITACKARLYDCHFKDINALRAKNAGAAEVEVGRGLLDIRGMLSALLKTGFTGHVGFEHEKTAENPLPGLAESVGYTKGVLSCVA